MKYFYILFTILFTVYGQLILKWRMDIRGEMPSGSFQEKVMYLFQVLIDPWVISSFFAAFLASITWMLALTKFELSFVYPFMSLSFVLVFIFSVFFFKEVVNYQKIIGLLLVILGLIILVKK